MKSARRKFLHLAAVAVTMPVVSRVAWAQTYPTRPITMVVPFPAGGVTDTLGRVVAERMGRYLKQVVIIENVSGAEGSVGIGRAARARSDGYVIDLGQVDTHVLNGALYSLGYDVLNDFVPIAPLVTAPLILFAKKATSPKDMTELIAWLKANPNKASAASGVATTRLLIAFFQKETATQLTRVPYRGEAPAIQDLVAGQIDLAFGSPFQMALVRAGSIKAYAVTADTRVAVAPDVPTFRELGLPTLSYAVWLGLFAPRGTPRDVIAKLNAAAVEAMSDPSVRARLAELGLEAVPRERQTSEVLGAMVKAVAEKWWPIVKELGIRAE
jgi:tripartite-type tricarboxylate transporter receptor subunit TctC